MTLEDFLKNCQYRLYKITVQDDEHNEASETESLFYGLISEMPKEFNGKEIDCWGLNSNPRTGDPEVWVWLK